MASNTLPQETVTEPMAYSLQELHRRTGLSELFFRNEARDGALKITRFGRRVLVLREDWDAYLKSRPTNN
jgi:excisionase family DNA binding protein